MRAPQLKWQPLNDRTAHRCFPVIALALLIAGGGACKASPFLEKRHVTYNFQDEGFLSSRVLQTVGRSQLEADASWGTAGARRRCLATAQQIARERTLRVLLHTRLNLQGNQPEQAPEVDGLGGSSFERDYPLNFSPRDLLRAEIDFRALLDRGVIVLEENRQRDSCSVVFRIESPAATEAAAGATDVFRDLPSEIRAVPLSFAPQIRQHQANRRPEPASRSALQPMPQSGAVSEPETNVPN